MTPPPSFSSCSKSVVIVFCHIVMLTVSAANAQPHPCAYEEQSKGELSEGSPLEFKLKAAGETYGIAGLVVLNPDFSSLSFTVGKQISVHLPDKNPDRYRRLTGQVFTSDKNGKHIWLQGKMLERGLALVSGTTKDNSCHTAMLVSEKRAQQQKAGIWANNKIEFGAANLEQLSEKSGHFVIVTGKVLSVGDRKTRLYLNFGQKWSQDFTALIVKKGKNAFTGDIDRLKKLKGALVRVRGIIEQSGGPMIRVTGEAQIEIQ